MKKAFCCNFLFWNYPRLKDLWSHVDERQNTGARFLNSLSLLCWRNNPGLLSCFESFLLLPINVTYCNDYKKISPDQISTTKKVVCKNKRERDLLP